MKEYRLSMLNFIILSFGAHQAIKLDFISQIYKILRTPATVRGILDEGLSFSIDKIYQGIC